MMAVAYPKFGGMQFYFRLHILKMLESQMQPAFADA